MVKKLPTGAEWTFDKIDKYTEAIDRTAKDDFKLDTYNNQIEVISSEQMIDAYSSVGLPVGYKHWSYGKQVVGITNNYRKGRMGLAYEIVINSDPCISYLMEENTMAMQALVIAHACYGHNAYFKNNYLFKERTRADSIIDYLIFAQNYVRECEQKHGEDVVTEFIDHCHALDLHGVDYYPRPEVLSAKKQELHDQATLVERQANKNEFWDTIIPEKVYDNQDEDEYKFPKQPQENLLYFFEKYAPNLDDWQREILRIVRKKSEYFYPQMQCQVGNEGFATFTHYSIINKMADRNQIGPAFMHELIINHCNVVMQPDFDSPQYTGINPYALGWKIMEDIKRMCIDPTPEDYDWFPSVAGGDPIEQVQFAAYEFNDKALINERLSPAVMRDMRLFNVRDEKGKSYQEISSIHDADGYMDVRKALSRQYDVHNRIPNIEVTDVNVRGDRRLILRHSMVNNVKLSPQTAEETMYHVQKIWDFDVTLISKNDGVDVEQWSIDQQGNVTYEDFVPKAPPFNPWAGFMGGIF